MRVATYLKLILFLGIALFSVSYFLRDRLPDQADIDPRLLISPIQTQTAKKPFAMVYNDRLYMITPQYDYELYGLVVSARDLDKTWYNIDYKRDPYNIKDLCVIWGGNLAGSDFKKVRFSSGLWTCFYEYSGNLIFIHDAVSNNHLLPRNEAISKELGKVRKGDQIHLKGQLVNYFVEGKNTERRSSITRADMGNGACEVVYLEDFQILKDENAFWEGVNTISKYMIILSIIAFIYYYVVYTPPNWGH